MSSQRLDAYVPRLLGRRRGGDGPCRWETDGTLLFVDVAGFTRLTEKLATAGKIGAEEIVGAISSVFTALLTASGDDGDVLKFSGDAMLLFYEGEQHERRATAAALTMQRALRRVDGVDSLRGRVRLRMSAGIHTGRFHFFLCGGDHLELFVLGPDASTTVAVEAAAHAGDVLVSPATARVLDPASVTVAHEGRVVVRRAPQMPPARPSDDASYVAAERFVAPVLRDRLDDDEHEHRRATVAFVSFGGIDQLIADRRADEAFEHVQALTTVTITALEQHAVLLTATDIGTDGGTLMLTAGAPDATGDDEVRMLRVARSIIAANTGLPVCVGVHAGNVFVGAVGAPFRRTYSTMGAATNLAARVMHAADWGTVLATSAVTDRTRGRFELKPVEPFLVKGSRHPVVAAIVGDAVDEADMAADATIALVGRERELATATEALAGAKNGQGHVLEIVGALGVGKTRLVAEVHAGAEDVEWYSVYCDPYERTSTYHSARLLLRRALRIPPAATPDEAGALLSEVVTATAPDLCPWLPLIATPVGAAVPSTQEADDVALKYRRGRTQQAVCDLLAARPPRPAVIVVEDAHEMDDASAELLAALLARVVPTKPWLAIITRQDSTRGLHPGRGYDADELALAPLTAVAATDLAARLAEHTPVPAHLLDDLVDRAGGSPLFLAELVSAQATTADQMPRSVEAIVAARIDALRPADRRALRYMSVIGDRFTGTLLDEVLGPLGVDSSQHDRWARLQAFVSRSGNRFAFSNALTRQVAYEGLNYRRRRELHGRVADALMGTTGQRAAQLPLHLTRAERWDRAWSAAVAAADDARRDGANAVAGELYDMALLAARHLSLGDNEMAQTAERAGEVWEQAGLFERALEAYGVAASATDRHVDRLLLTLRRARVHESAGRYPQALRLCRRVLTQVAALPRGSERQRCLAWAHLGYASARMAQGRLAESAEHGQQALEAAGDDTRARAHAYHLLDRAHAALGDHRAAARYRDRALPIFAALGDLAAQGTVLHDLGADAHGGGRLEEALWLYERGYEVRMRAGNVVRAAESANAIGEVLVTLDQAEPARERFAHALRMWRGARAPEGVALATRNLGTVALRAGDADQACRRLLEAAQLATAHGLDSLRVSIWLPLAQSYVVLGRYVEAWEAATWVVDCGPDLDPADAAAAHRLRSEALRCTGGLQRAAGELARADSYEAQR